MKVSAAHKFCKKAMHRSTLVDSGCASSAFASVDMGSLKMQDSIKACEKSKKSKEDVKIPQSIQL